MILRCEHIPNESYRTIGIVCFLVIFPCVIGGLICLGAYNWNLIEALERSLGFCIAFGLALFMVPLGILFLVFYHVYGWDVEVWTDRFVFRQKYMVTEFPKEQTQIRLVCANLYDASHISQAYGLILFKYRHKQMEIDRLHHNYEQWLDLIDWLDTHKTEYKEDVRCSPKLDELYSEGHRVIEYFYGEQIPERWKHAAKQHEWNASVMKPQRRE